MENTLKMKSDTMWSGSGWMLISIAAIYSLLLFPGYFLGGFDPAIPFLILSAVVIPGLTGLLLVTLYTYDLTFGPEGITQKSALRTVFIPREELRFLYCREKVVGRSGNWYRNIYVSSKSLEELAELRKERLQNGVLSRQELTFRLRAPRWQIIFAQELLERPLSRRAYAHYLGQGDDLLAFLERMYPELSTWKYSTMERSDHVSGREDLNSFSRRVGADAKQENGAMAMLVAIIFAAPACLCIIFPEIIVMILALLGVIGMMMLFFLLLCPQWEKDQIRLQPQGMEILRRGKVHRSFRAEEISCITEGYFTYGKYIAVSALTLDSMAALQMERIRKYPWVRRKCEPIMALPDWKLRLARCYMNSTSVGFSGRNPHIQFMDWTSERAKHLRETYPQAAYMELPSWHDN